MFSRIVAGVAFLLLSVPVSVFAAEDADAGKPTTASGNDKEKKAQHEIKLADSLRQNNSPAQAADLYLHAFTIAPQVFSYAEKIAIAKFLASIDRRQDAIDLLNKTIKLPHEGFEAELTLANILSSNVKDANVRTATFYIHALKIAPQKFNYDEKIAIAKIFIKNKQRQAAMNLLQNMANEPHKGFTAETMLAKLRVSSGQHDAALQDANEILQRDDKNIGALLIKGGELKRRKSFGDAISAYRAILAKKDDFDARLGLTYCLLAIGKKEEAEKQFKLLHAEDEWQQYDLDELARSITLNVRPRIDYMSTRFSDSDNYEGTEQDFTGKMNLSDWGLSISARHRTTTGDGINANADTGILFLDRNISENWRILAGSGVTKLSLQLNTPNEDKLRSFRIGELHIDTQVFKGSAQLSYSRNVLTANAFLIQNGVGVDSSQFVYNRLFGKSLTIKTLYKSNVYSDDNSSREFNGTLLWALNKSAPLFSLGYAYRYLNFQYPTTQGYFDPQDYSANKLLFLTAYEHGSFYLYAEYAGGRQTYIHHQVAQDDKLEHVGLATGISLWKDFHIEFSMEKNNADASASDYAYGDLSASWRISYTL